MKPAPRPWSRPLSRGLVGTAMLLAAFLAAILGLGRINTPGALANRPAAVDPRVAAGALDYVTFGCENCHGLYGRGGVKVPNISGQATIPALNTAAIRKSLNDVTLRFFIQHGVVLKSSVAQVYMPV